VPTNTFPKTKEFATNSTMVIIPHPLSSLDLVPCHFAVSQIENETDWMTF
jgi:hypothetical protein